MIIAMRICKIRNKPCIYATEYGYCSFTICVAHGKE